MLIISGLLQHAAEETNILKFRGLHCEESLMLIIKGTYVNHNAVRYLSTTSTLTPGPKQSTKILIQLVDRRLSILRVLAVFSQLARNSSTRSTCSVHAY
jgi:hypothetical protein